MTQLYIASTEVVLPSGFSVTVKRENPFFTKSGEYTYDIELRLDNPVNLQLYGFLNRLNRTEQLYTGRQAILMADGHVYCRGTEVITRWTDQTVSVQIVSGESELNWLVGQEKKIEELDMGSVPASDLVLPGGGSGLVCLPTIRTSEGKYLNRYTISRGTQQLLDPVAQPFLTTLVEKILTALGYEIGTNHLRQSLFSRLFIVNTLHTTSFAEMLKGWTVKDFLEEVERLTGTVIITDNNSRSCDIVLRSTYYSEADMLPLRDVVDAYQMEVADDDGRTEEFTSNNVSYDLPSHRWAQFMRLPEDLLKSATIVDCQDLQSVKTEAATHDANQTVIFRDTSTGRLYVRVVREGERAFGSTTQPWQQYYLLEVNTFADLKRTGVTSTMELRITPAPMGRTDGAYYEIPDLGTTEGYNGSYTSNGYFGGNSGEETTGEGEEEEPVVEEEKPFEELIRGYSRQDSSAIDLYCAFCHDVRLLSGEPFPYTDAYHAIIQTTLYDISIEAISLLTLSHSLRLEYIDQNVVNNAYTIDTSKTLTVETFDPNRIDVRQVYAIDGGRYVVKEVEETITANGRAPMWRVTCHPILISDETLEHRWVLTHGVWDDGAAWLDDGRWIDNPTE